MSFASTFLASPTLRLRVPASALSTADEKTYTVHRALLATHTNLLAAATRSTTSITLPATTPIPALERLLEFLYTGTYTLAAAPPADDGPSPVLAAAIAGRIGVWGKPAARHEPTDNISSYSSTHCPEYRNAYSSSPESSYATAPASPDTFAPYDPVLNHKRTRSLELRGPAPTETPAMRLAAHLDVYTLALRYAAADLVPVVLSKLAAELRTSRALLRELVREVYGTKTRDAQLSAFVVDTVTGDWSAWRGEEVVRGLMKDGGEFVVDLVAKVQGF
ncbi:hypothetical protein EDC01DRAFT_634208 [Geopyxis carbonaria]|nr:hypothetical protein EDC01DRAFT_634208 [Geopyxis carbonaria]